MSRFVKRFPAVISAFLMLVLSGSLSAETITTADYLPLLSSDEERIYFEEGEECENAQAPDAAVCDSWDSLGREYSAGTRDIGGETYQVQVWNAEEEYYRDSSSGRSYVGSYWYNEFRRHYHDEGERVYSFVNVPADLAQLTAADLTGTNLTEFSAAPAQMETGVAYQNSFISFDTEKGHDYLFGDTFLADQTAAGELLNNTFTGTTTLTLVGAVDFTQSIADISAADSDFADLMQDAEMQEIFTDWSTSFTDSNFLTSLRKVVREFDGVEFEEGEFGGSETAREVMYLAQGIGVVFAFETNTFVAPDGVSTETEQYLEGLLSYNVSGASQSSFHLGRKDVVVNTTGANGTDDGLVNVAVEMFCGPFGTPELPELNNLSYREQTSSWKCGKGVVLGNPYVNSVTVPVLFYSEFAVDDETGQIPPDDKVVFGARASNYLHEYDSAFYLPGEVQNASVSFDMEHGAIVSGTIFDVEGNPANNARVEYRVFDAPPSDQSYSHYGFTGDDGVYTANIEPGVTYKVQICDESWLFCGYIAGPDNVIDTSYYDRNSFTASASTNGNDIAATIDGHYIISTTTDATVSGVVVDGNMQPIIAAVWVWSSDGSFNAAKAQSDANGQFSVDVIQGKEYLVEVSPAWNDETQSPITEFSGGNWFIDSQTGLYGQDYNPEDPTSQPVFNASDVNASTCYLGQDVESLTMCTDMGVTGFVPGAILPIWGEMTQTRFLMDTNSLNLAIAVDMGTPVSGRIVDSEGNGIDNAWVSGGIWGVVGDSTDAEGYFTLRLPSDGNGSFQVQVWPGWNEQTQTQDNSFVGGVVTGNADDGFELTNMPEMAALFTEDGSDWPTTALPNSETGLLLQLQASLTIDGTVTGLAPEQYAWINAWSPDTGFGNGTYTQPDGSFSMPVPTPQAGEQVTYYVELWSETAFSTDSFEVVVDESGVLSVNGDSGVTTVGFALETGNAISGRVVDDSGNAVPWMWVEFQSTEVGEYNYPLHNFGTSTNEDGFYQISLPAGSYIGAVFVWDGRYKNNFYNGTADGAETREAALPIDISAGDTGDINFRLSQGASISGSVDFTSAPADGEELWVNVYSESQQHWSGTQIRGDGSATSFTYTVSGLVDADDYRLDIWGNDYMGGHYGGQPGAAAEAPVSWEQATELDTTVGNVTDVNLLMSTGSTLSLTITGDFQVGTWFDANVWSDETQRGGWAGAQATQAGTITLEMAGIDPAEGSNYRLWVNSNEGGYLNGFYQGDLTTTPGSLSNWDQATLFDMTADRDLAVAVSSGGSISGTITNLPAGTRTWIDAWSEMSGSWGGVEVIGTGSPVDYTINGLALERDYRVHISPDGMPGGYWAGPTNTSVTAWHNAGRVDISDTNNSDFTGADITLETGRTISGTVDGWAGTGEYGWVDTWSHLTHSWAGASVSDTEQSYELLGLKPGDGYGVSLWADGYVHQYVENVNLTDNDQTHSFTLSTGGSISGSITGLDPYQMVWLDAWSPNNAGWGYDSVTADASGNATYEIEGLGDGNYVVAMWTNFTGYFYNSTGAVLMWDQADQVAVSGAEVTDIDFAVTGITTHTLSGTVTITGADAEDANTYRYINVWSNSGGWGWADRQGDGSYTVSGLPAGDYYVDVSAPNAVSVRLDTSTLAITGGDVSGEGWTTTWDHTQMGTVSVTEDTIGLDVALDKGVEISGQVTDGTNPLSYVWVNAYSDSSGYANGAMTDSNGNYTIEAVAPNATYTVSVWTPSGEASTDVAVATSDVADADIVITQEAGSISGTVTESSAAAEGIIVLVYEQTGAFVVGAATNASGGYSIEGLTPETLYTVEVYTSAAFDAQTPSDSVSVTATSSGTVQDFTL